MFSVSVSLGCNARSFLESKQSILGGGLRECQPNHHHAKGEVLLRFTALDLANCLGYDDRIEKKQRQDQARNMTILVGGVSRTINASPPAG